MVFRTESTRSYSHSVSRSNSARSYDRDMILDSRTMIKDNSLDSSFSKFEDNELPQKQQVTAEIAAVAPAKKNPLQKRRKPRYQSGDAVKHITCPEHLSYLEANSDFPVAIKDEEGSYRLIREKFFNEI